MGDVKIEKSFPYCCPYCGNFHDSAMDECDEMQKAQAKMTTAFREANLLAEAEYIKLLEDEGGAPYPEEVQQNFRARVLELENDVRFWRQQAQNEPDEGVVQISECGDCPWAAEYAGGRSDVCVHPDADFVDIDHTDKPPSDCPHRVRPTLVEIKKENEKGTIVDTLFPSQNMDARKRIERLIFRLEHAEAQLKLEDIKLELQQILEIL